VFYTLLTSLFCITRFCSFFVGVGLGERVEKADLKGDICAISDHYMTSVQLVVVRGPLYS
jgi:hypothetical protein